MEAKHVNISKNNFINFPISNDLQEEDESKSSPALEIRIR